MGLDKALRQAFESTCELVRIEPTEEPDPTQETKPGCCHALGVCVCKRNPDAHHCWVNLRAFMKQIFWKKKKVASVPRQLLQKYLVFMEFSGYWAVLPTPSLTRGSEYDSEWEDLYEKETPMEPRLSAKLYFHIGRMNFKTWHGSVLQMELAENQHVPSGVLRLQPKQSDADGGPGPCVFADLQMFDALFPLVMQWRLRFLTLSTDPDHWTLEQDGSVAVIPIPDTQEFVVWQGSEAEFERRKAELAAKRKAAAKRRGPRGPRVNRGKKLSKKDMGKRHHAPLMNMTKRVNRTSGTRLKRKQLPMKLRHGPDDLNRETQTDLVAPIPYENSSCSTTCCRRHSSRQNGWN